ncbi:uncharacterized protein LOC122723353 [Manihot esculenta]|uniref:uncharacterized protein LOC122723353 n=1 Tax=Manihot esculenta TaxID=3983 RepID=UPI001CC7DE59|nr:uncharacterized protein LOC122723353 [Manihot esculenta]
MDFVVGLPLTLRKKDVIWVIVDRLTKSAHFILVRTDYSLEKYAELYINEIVRLHGVPLSIISDRDPRFTARFWEKLHEALGTKLNFSTSFHPQTDGQSERVIQTLEDMLRKLSEAKLIGPDLVRETEEKVRTIKKRLKAASDRQKPYADLKRKDIVYEVGDKVFLKVSPWKMVLRFGKKGKLSPRYRSDTSHVISSETIDIQPDLTYEEELVKILAREIKELRNKKIPLAKILWRNYKTEEATWESEELMRQQHPQLFMIGKF